MKYVTPDTSEESTDNFIDGDEFKYSVAELTSASTGNCIKCGEEFHSNKNAVCRDCLKTLTIVKTEAKKIYKLRDEDLVDIPGFQYYNQYNILVNIYYLKEVRLKAIEKKFKITKPSLGQYIHCINALVTESLTASKERSTKIATNKKIHANIRRDKLTEALQKHGLEIRSDSYYCNQYLEGKEFTLQQVVDMMITMDFFVNHTKYNEIISKKIEEYERNNDASDCEYHERMYLDEDDKDDAKRKALRIYLKHHDR